MLERFSSDRCSSIFPFECVRQADGHQQVVLYQHIHHRKQAVAVYLNESARFPPEVNEKKYTVPCMYTLLARWKASQASLTVDMWKSSGREHQGTDDASGFVEPSLLWRRGLVEVKSACQEELHQLQTATISLSSLLFWSGKEVACRRRIKSIFGGGHRGERDSP